MYLKFLVPVILLFGCALGACRSQSSAFSAAENANDGSPVIIEINGFEEHRSAFERFVKARLSDFATQAGQTQAEQDQLRSRLFDEFVRRQLVVREALKKNIVPTEDEIRKAVEDQHKQTSGEGSDQNQNTLEGTERRAEMLNDLLTLKFYTSEVLKDVDVTAQEIEAYYNQNRAKYQQQNGFYVREIRVPEEADARRLHQQAVAKPNDFNVLAKENSKSPTAINGGLMYYETQQLPPVLEQAITPLKAGEISHVVKSNHGYHIFKLEKRAEPLTLEQVKEDIKKELTRSKNQTLIDQFNERALTAARLKIYHDRLGFTYSGSLKAGA
ncbi:MAG: peptidyl-prolyl cis-trans isomerase [Acidobacteria bacterium]|nr:peptidyl-prolyl cis-trans isomerase [Acidobacteriota bacterium]MBI3424257.1 peptidyl-prolyl cis-trans isomerase [Acidobacteriota bacterium]